MQPLATATRHRLVEDHLQIPHSVVAKHFPHIRSSIALEDIIADGRTGLVEAANTFDPTRGNTFKTFAWYRVRGAILDRARRLGPRSRSEQERYLKSTGETGFTHHPLNCRREQQGVALRAGEYEWPDMERTIDRRRLAVRALAEVAKLSKRDQALIESFYIAGRTMQETATVLGHCEFYTSRLHGKVLRKLRQALKVHANVMPVDES